MESVCVINQEPQSAFLVHSNVLLRDLSPFRFAPWFEHGEHDRNAQQREGDEWWKEELRRGIAELVANRVRTHRGILGFHA